MLPINRTVLPKCHPCASKVLGGILIALSLFIGGVFAMMSIGTENNRQIIYASFSLIDIPVDMDVDSTLNVVNMKANFESIDTIISENDFSCNDLWLKSVFFARYIDAARPSYSDI